MGLQTGSLGCFFVCLFGFFLFVLFCFGRRNKTFYSKKIKTIYQVMWVMNSLISAVVYVRIRQPLLLLRANTLCGTNFRCTVSVLCCLGQYGKMWVAVAGILCVWSFFTWRLEKKIWDPEYMRRNWIIWKRYFLGSQKSSFLFCDVCVQEYMKIIFTITCVDPESNMGFICIIYSATSH